MGDVIIFKTRKQLEMEKRQQIIDDWNTYIEWEEKMLSEHQKQKETETCSEGK